MIFVDSSFWIALLLRRDGWHQEAMALFQRHGGADLITSNHVRGETWTFLRRRAGHQAGIDFLDRLERTPRVEVTYVGAAMEALALHWLRRHGERPYSFVDATSFAVMHDRAIQEALAFDGDFSAAGFVELRAP